MKTTLLAILLLAAAPALADEPVRCSPDGTQIEMNLCAKQDLDAADAELNAAYRAILARHSDGQVFRNKIKAAQRLWVQLRDADLDARFPLADGQDPRAQYGSIYPLQRAEAAAALTRERTRYLHRQWPDDAAAGH